MNILRRGIEYNHWANQVWLDCLTRTNAPDEDLKIFQHILASTKVWALRCHGISVTEMPKPELTKQTLDELTKMWLDILDGRDLEEAIAYKRTTGEPNEMTISWIAQHVINHGTYHRGELRGLRRARGDNDFPDTDIAGYALL
jgi:uncharacterized damage-inducible protein DinB